MFVIRLPFDATRQTFNDNFIKNDQRQSVKGFLPIDEIQLEH